MSRADLQPEVAASRPSVRSHAGERTAVLVVDDSPFDRQLVGQLLASLPELEVLYADSIGAGMHAIERGSPSIVLTDLILPDGEGLALVKHIREQHPSVIVVLMTAYGSEDVAMQALRAGAANYIAKSKITHDLIPTIRVGTRRWPPRPGSGREYSSAWSGQSQCSSSATIPS